MNQGFTGIDTGSIQLLESRTIIEKSQVHVPTHPSLVKTMVLFSHIEQRTDKKPSCRPGENPVPAGFFG